MLIELFTWTWNSVRKTLVIHNLVQTWQVLLTPILIESLTWTRNKVNKAFPETCQVLLMISLAPMRIESLTWTRNKVNKTFPETCQVLIIIFTHAYADWIACTDMKFDTQDFGNTQLSTDLTGFTHAYIDWIAYMDTNKVNKTFPETCQVLIIIFTHACADWIVDMDMKFGTQGFGNTSPSSNLTGLTHTYSDWIACMDMNLNTQHFHGDLSGLLLICPFAMLIESLVSSRNKVNKAFPETCQVLLMISLAPMRIESLAWTWA
jgi:hypothetical protein